MTTDFQLRLSLDEALAITLRRAGMGVAEMADYLGVTRGTVGNWTGGRIVPNTQSLRLWALRTGVPYEWLCAIRDSNPEPADLEHHRRVAA